jgi:hypothetical protein
MISGAFEDCVRTRLDFPGADEDLRQFNIYDSLLIIDRVIHFQTKYFKLPSLLPSGGSNAS